MTLSSRGVQKNCSRTRVWTFNGTSAKVYELIENILSQAKQHSELQVSIRDSSANIDHQIARGFDEGATFLDRRSIDWLCKVDTEYERFRERPSYNVAQLEELLNSGEEQLDQHTQEPIASAIRIYFVQLREIGHTRENLVGMLAEAEHAFRKAEANIREEHGEE